MCVPESRTTVHDRVKDHEQNPFQTGIGVRYEQGFWDAVLLFFIFIAGVLLAPYFNGAETARCRTSETWVLSMGEFENLVISFIPVMRKSMFSVTLLAIISPRHEILPISTFRGIRSMSTAPTGELGSR